MCCYCSLSGFSDGKYSAKHCCPMFGLCVVRDWLLGVALGCATILLILGRIFSGLDLLGTSGKTVGRTGRNSAAAPPQLRLATPLERLPTDLPTRLSVIPRKQGPAARPCQSAGRFRLGFTVVVASGNLFHWLFRNQPGSPPAAVIFRTDVSPGRPLRRPASTVASMVHRVHRAAD